MNYEVLVTVNGEGSTLLTFPESLNKAVCLRELSSLAEAYLQDVCGIGDNRESIKKLIKSAEDLKHSIAFKALQEATDLKEVSELFNQHLSRIGMQIIDQQKQLEQLSSKVGILLDIACADTDKTLAELLEQG